MYGYVKFFNVFRRRCKVQSTGLLLEQELIPPYQGVGWDAGPSLASFLVVTDCTITILLVGQKPCRVKGLAVHKEPEKK